LNEAHRLTNADLKMPDVRTVSARPLIGRLACTGSLVKYGIKPISKIEVTFAGLGMMAHSHRVLGCAMFQVGGVIAIGLTIREQPADGFHRKE
jgi:hypothetical protein